MIQGFHLIATTTERGTWLQQVSYINIPDGSSRAGMLGEYKNFQGGWGDIKNEDNDAYPDLFTHRSQRMVCAFDMLALLCDDPMVCAYAAWAVAEKLKGLKFWENHFVPARDILDLAFMIYEALVGRIIPVNLDVDDMPL